MPGPIYLEGDRLTLRTAEAEDVEFLGRYWNRPAFRHWFAKSDPLDRSSLAEFLDADETEVHFLPCRDGDPVGFVWLFHLDDVASRGELGYWVRPEEQGQGYATAAGRLGKRYAFEERGLHKLLARVLEGNDASRRVLEKLDFERVGRLRDHYYVDGGYTDAVLFECLADGRTDR